MTETSDTTDERKQAAWNDATDGLTADQREHLAYWALGYLQSDVPVERWEAAMTKGRDFVTRTQAVSA